MAGITAMRALADAAVWTGGQILPDQATIFETIQNLPARDRVILDRKAEPPAATQTLKARYLRPYGMHGSIGPSCAVADLQDGVMTVWTHTQGVFPDRAALAELLGIPVEKVRCIHTEASGNGGHSSILKAIHVRRRSTVSTLSMLNVAPHTAKTRGAPLRLPALTPLLGAS